MSGAMQSLGNFAGQMGQGNYLQGAEGLGKDLWSGLTSAPQQGGTFSQLGNILQNVGPYAGLAAAVPQAMQQYGIYNKLANPKWGQIPAQAQETIRQAVEGQAGSQFGSGAPALVSRGLANADWQYQLAANQQNLQSLFGALQGGQQPGSLEHILAAITGGLGQDYSSSAGSASKTGNIDPNTGYPTAYSGQGDITNYGGLNLQSPDNPYQAGVTFPSPEYYLNPIF